MLQSGNGRELSPGRKSWSSLRRENERAPGAADCGQYRQAAGASAESLIALLSRLRTVGVTAVEKHELSKIDFELIEDAFKALLQSRPDPMTADKITDLRDKFRDAFTGWLEIEEAA
jgi:hypothetical protein